MKYLLRILGVVVVILVVIGVGIYFFREQILSLVFKPTDTTIPEKTLSPSEATSAADQSLITQPEVVASNLDIPWEVAFLPDSSLLVTERPGTLLRITTDTDTQIPVSGVLHRGEGGLLGMALHPDFTANNWVYLYLTTQSDGQITNRVDRYTFDMETNQLSERTAVIESIPGAANHDGGRIAFGPDGYLYIATGDAQNAELAQNTDSLAGKILRITDTGEVPVDNPFNNPVYSYGHRNPQGLAWDATGQLWATEHGPSGAGSGYDEVNLIEKGVNYGWPTIQGAETAEGMRTPVIQSGANDTWAPAAATIWEDQLFFTGLRGQAIYTAQVANADLTNLQTLFRNEYGRLRIVAVSPDGMLYFGTSNTDGRGTPQPNNDTLYRISAEALK